MAAINVRKLQSPIHQRYKEDPAAVQIRLKVRSAQADLGDPLHCAAHAESTPDIVWRSGAQFAMAFRSSRPSPCSTGSDARR